MNLTKKMILSIERIFVVIAISAYTGAFARLFISRIGVQTVVQENNIFGQAFFVLTYLIAFLHFFSQPKRLLISIQKMPSVWLLVLWALFSFAWSYFPEITLRRSIALIGTTLFASYIATRFTLTENFELLGFSLLLVIISCYFFTFISPVQTFWTGVFFTKNELARTSLIALFVYTYLLFATKKPFWGISMIAAFILMYQSSSVTAIIISEISLVIVLMFILLHNTSKKIKLNIIAISVLIISLILIIICSNLASVFELFQRDLGFSGRVPLWNMVWKAIQQNPVLGYGYGAFWNGWKGPSAIIWDGIYWLPPHAHNGFLDIALDLGIVGVILYIFVYISFLRLNFKYQQKSKTYKLFLSLFAVFLLIYNMVENIALNRNSIVWLVLVMFFVQSTSMSQGLKSRESFRE